MFVRQFFNLQEIPFMAMRAAGVGNNGQIIKYCMDMIRFLI